MKINNKFFCLENFIFVFLRLIMADEYISIYDIGETQDDKDVQYKNQNEEIPLSLPSNFKPEIVSKVYFDNKKSLNSIY